VSEKPVALTEAGEMFLLAAATMGGGKPWGRGCWPMINRLSRDGLVTKDDGYWYCTPAGRDALKTAGYQLSPGETRADGAV
jgi:hypothetical protein